LRYQNLGNFFEKNIFFKFFEKIFWPKNPDFDHAKLFLKKIIFYNFLLFFAYFTQQK